MRSLVLDRSMPFTKPVVIDNQQVIALDFNDLADLPEELLRRFIQNLVVDVSTYGWVLHGLAVTDTSAGAVTSVQIGAGACILPSSAGDDGYRLVIVPANIDVPLTLPGAGTRTDVIQIVLQETATENAARFVRSLGPGDEPQAVQQNINTRLRVTGVQGVNEGGGTVASPGAVRLASVEMDTTEITEITDLRTYVLRNSGTITTSLGDYTADTWTSISAFTNLMTNALSLLTTRVNVNTATNGKLKETVQPSAGSNLTLDADELNLGAGRALNADGMGSFQGVKVARSGQAADFQESLDLLKINGASVARAIAKAYVTLTWNAGTSQYDFTSMAVNAHGIGIVRTSEGAYTVTLNAALQAGLGVALGGPKFVVEVQEDPYTLLSGGADADKNAEAGKYISIRKLLITGDASNVFRVLINETGGGGIDRSFSVKVFGPVE